MKFRIITIMIVSLIVVSTANAFEFRGFKYKWGANKTEVIKNESSISASPARIDKPDQLVYEYQSEWGPAFAIYRFEKNKLIATCLYHKPGTTNYSMYHSIKRVYEKNIGETITVDPKSCWLLSADAFIQIMFVEDNGGSQGNGSRGRLLGGQIILIRPFLN